MNVIAGDDRPACGWTQAFAWLNERAQRHALPLCAAVVLVPYAQLMAPARRRWQQAFPQGFAPRFETTRNWAGQFAAPRAVPTEFTGERARDAITARELLARAGLAAHADLLAGPLLEMAGQLAPAAAAVPPERRAAWGDVARALLPAGGVGSAMQLEAAAAQVALEWVLSSRHASDALFSDQARASARLLLVIEGLQPDPLARALLARWEDDGCAVALDEPAPAAAARIALHAAEDGEAEAQRGAACVLAHLAGARAPVALVATDRALTRRICALLQQAGVPLQDETGWTLSTTRAAAHVMAALRACAREPDSDTVLDWLKHCPAAGEQEVRALERWLRKAGAHRWSAAADQLAARAGQHAVPAALAERCQGWRATLQGRRPLADWLAALRTLLQATQAWDALAADAAGARVLAELHLPPGLDAALSEAEGAHRRLGLPEFTRWAGEVLECARHRPDYPAGAPVVVLPLAQVLGRAFAALVLPGCDEKRLQGMPEPPGAWTSAQRQALGLPTREALAQAQAHAWRCALATTQVDVVWRSGEGGEPLLPSPLVQALRLDGQAAGGLDASVPRRVAAAPVARPSADGSTLGLARLSASAYDDLRQCPYRFFALRLLGLRDDDELDGRVGKRDFGAWLHAVLQHFHEALLADGQAERGALMDAAAERVSRQMGLQSGDFLPYSSAWPAVRGGYLAWLAEHEAGAGAAFERAEERARQPLADVELVGKLDRVDRVRAPDGGAPAYLVIDYKCEDARKTAERVKPGAEDTQLAFYAALMPPGSALRAAYVNVGERGTTRLHELADVSAQRERLLAGIEQDVRRIASGAPLHALGEGGACTWCGARGLCRRDFWND